MTTHSALLRSVKIGCAGLLVLAWSAPVLAARARPARAVVLPPKLDLPAIPIVFSTPRFPTLAEQMKASTGNALSGGIVPRRSIFHGCGGMGVRLVVDPRPNQLVLPLAALGEAYLKCRMIRVNLLAPEVPVASYPPGYFGDWTDDGIMVLQRAEFTDEAQMRALFLQLAASTDVPEDDEDSWLYAEDEDMTVGKFLKNSVRGSQWTIDFVGEVPVHLAFVARAGRLFVEAGDRWSSYALSAGQAAALAEMLTPAPLAY